MTAFLLAVLLTPTRQSQKTPIPDQISVTEIHQVGGDVLPPSVIASTEPVYPRSHWHKNTDHHVVVHVVVNTSGLPQDIKVLTSGSKPFDDAALKAVRTYRFRPATELGKAVPVEINIDVQFKVL